MDCRETWRFELDNRKGVITSKLPRHRMPVDKDGNSADIVMAPDGTIARTNFARLYLMHLGGAARDMTKRLKQWTGLDKNCSPDDVEYMDDEKFNFVWGQLMEYYDCINPEAADLYRELPENLKRLHVYESIEAGVVNIRPIDCKKPLAHAVLDLDSKFPQTFGPLTHQLVEDGKTETTIQSMSIQPLPFMLLDKTADDTLAVGTAALGPFGVPIKSNQGDKYSKPWKDSPPRASGESESRQYAANTKSPEMIADMLDRSNNPTVQLTMARRLVSSETPGNIEDIIDREKHPYGMTKSLELAANLFQSFGARLKYVPEDMDPHHRPVKDEIKKGRKKQQ